MSLIRVRDLIASYESGFACGKSQHVQVGLKHLRPFNITVDGRLDFSSLYVVPPAAAPAGKDQLHSGDVLFNNTNSVELVGKSALVENDVRAGFSNHLTRIRLDRERVEPRYFAYWLRSEQGRGTFAAGCTRWVSQAAYRVEQLGDLLIRLPPLSVQQKRADQLYVAEAILRLRREAQRKAAELIPALFLDRFGDPASNPKGWPVAPLSEVAAVMSGATKGRRIDPADAIDVPYMRVANVKDGHLDLGEIKTIQIRADELARLSLERGDLLMTEGGDPDKLGRAAIWTGAVTPCIHQNHIFKVRANRSIALPEYLRSLVGSAYGKVYFLRVAKKTTGIASINKTQLSAFPVLLPPLAEQAAFVRDVEAVESIITLHEQAGTKAQATFDALLHQAFAT